MRKEYRIGCVTAGISAVVLTALRVFIEVAPLKQAVAESAGKALFVLTLAAVAFLIGLCARRQQVAVLLTEKPATALAAGAAICGITMLVSAVFDLGNWWIRGEVPYPGKAVLTGADVAFFYGLVLTAFFGGLFLVLLSMQWALERRVIRGIYRVWALVPVVWLWFRIARYELSYESSLNGKQNIYEVLMLVLEMMFFLLLARYVSGVQEKDSRFLAGVSLSTGLVSLTNGIARLSALVMQGVTGSDCLVLAPDFGVAVLAFTLAVGLAIQTPVSVDKPQTETEDTELLPEQRESLLFYFREQQAAEPEAEPNCSEKTPPQLEDVLKEVLDERE